MKNDKVVRFFGTQCNNDDQQNDARPLALTLHDSELPVVRQRIDCAMLLMHYSTELRTFLSPARTAKQVSMTFHRRQGTHYTIYDSPHLFLEFSC